MTLTTEQILDLYRSGSYGTPAAPIRSSSVKATFWLVYFGHRKASEYKNNIHHAAAVAGAKAATDGHQSRIRKCSLTTI